MTENDNWLKIIMKDRILIWIARGVGFIILLLIIYEAARFVYTSQKGQYSKLIWFENNINASHDTIKSIVYKHDTILINKDTSHYTQKVSSLYSKQKNIPKENRKIENINAKNVNTGPNYGNMHIGDVNVSHLGFDETIKNQILDSISLFEKRTGKPIGIISIRPANNSDKDYFNAIKDFVHTQGYSYNTFEGSTISMDNTLFYNGLLFNMIYDSNYLILYVSKR